MEKKEVRNEAKQEKEQIIRERDNTVETSRKTLEKLNASFQLQL